MKKLLSVCQACTYYLIHACWPDSGEINQNMNSTFQHLPKKIKLPKNGIISEGSIEDFVKSHRKAASRLLQYYYSPKSRPPQRGLYPPHSRNLTTDSSLWYPLLFYSRFHPSSPIPRSGKVYSVPAPAPQKYPLKLILVSSRLQNSRNARQENILVRDETKRQSMWTNEGAPRKRVWERIHLKSRSACILYASFDLGFYTTGFQCTKIMWLHCNWRITVNMSIP